jgi:hypothetical protein
MVNTILKFFALDPAETFSGDGVRALAVSGAIPVPLIALSVRNLGADSGDTFLNQDNIDGYS